MRALVQRVSTASVDVDGQKRAKIDKGLLVLIGLGRGDSESLIPRMADKIAQLRIFSDSEGKMNLDVRQVGGAILLVSQFTLYGDARKGNRPSYIEAAEPERARILYEELALALRAKDIPVETGVFGAHMEVASINDGPVTLWIEL
jgi:D-tyrosyl-tRNA(Tyr) deacylase